MCGSACGAFVVIVLVTIVICKRRGLILIVIVRESELVANNLSSVCYMFLAPLLPDAPRTIGNCEGGFGWRLSVWENNPTRSRRFC